MKIACILVLYKFNPALLQKCIFSVRNQVDRIFIMDNSIDKLNPILGLNKEDYYKKMNGNVGIAAAQNCGIREAIRNGFDFILFMDQDSVAPPNLVSKLLASYFYLENKSIIVGGVGPRPYNRSARKIYRGRIIKGKSVEESLTEVPVLINSASLVPISVFDKVGMMDESLFIDYVDFEFCWRAEAIGKYRFFICEDILLNHLIGEGDRNLFGFNIRIVTPFRIYFIFRNYFWLIRKSYVPMYWKISVGIKNVIKMFYFPLCISLNEYVRPICRGIRDGFKGERR